MTISYETDAIKLGKLIELPMPPLEARWQTTEKGVRTAGIGPTDFELVAILEFADAAILQLEKQMVEQTNPSVVYVAKTFVQSWFPETIREAFVVDDLYPDYLRLAARRFQPELFAKGSLQDGYVVIVGNQVLLYLHTM